MKLARPSTKWVAIGVVGLGVLASAVTIQLRANRHGAHQAATVVEGSAIEAPAEWAVGEARVFAAQLDTRVTTGGETLVEVALTGSWKLTRLTATRMVGEFEVARLKLAKSPESEARVRAALAEAVVFELSEGGTVSGIGFEKGEQPDAAFALSRGLLRSLASSFQISKPAHEAARKWTASELDFSGPYDAAYERTGPRSLLKSKRTYGACSSCGSTKAQTRVLRSHAELGLSDDAITPLNLVTLSSDEATQVEAGGPMPNMASETKVKLRLASRFAQGSALVALNDRARGIRLQPLDERSLDKRAIIDDAKLAGTTFASLSDEISRLDGQGKRASGPRARAFAQLATHLRYDQSAVSEALRRIRAGDPQRDTLIDALGNAGSEMAQSALRDLFGEQGVTESDRQNVVLALSFTPKPSEATTKLLGANQDDRVLGRQSRYGLGIAAYHLREDEPARAATIVSGLEERLAMAQTEQETIEYLRALGNAAQPSSLEAIKPYLQHVNASVRAAGANALRRIPGAFVDGLLASALNTDPSREVRLSAANALDYRERSAQLVSALESSLSTEGEREVRLQSTRIAVKWAAQQPRLRELLSQLSQHDPDKKIREVAGAAS